MRKRITGAGCSLVDYLYDDIDFSGKDIGKYRSRSPGDGGLTPGELVFAEDFGHFAGEGYMDALGKIVGDRAPAAVNLGGPAVVAMVHAAQLLAPEGYDVAFYGTWADDEIGRRLMEFLSHTPLSTEHYRPVGGTSPFTYVLSDPNYDGGNGERIFINNVGVASEEAAERLAASITEADVVLFGGTALVPPLHDRLHEHLERATAAGALTVVGTVYDFRNQRRSPDTPWPLGDTARSLQATGLIITDREEAVRLSGALSPAEAVAWFLAMGADAAVVTNGASPVTFGARDSGAKGRFHEVAVSSAPVLRSEPGEVLRGDTTGCGDNFVGGVLASSALQIERGEKVNIRECVEWGIASGSYARGYYGGLRIEGRRGENREAVERLLRRYRAKYPQNTEER